MTNEAYLPVFIQIALATIIVCGILAASHLLGQRAQKTAIKDSPYECGILPTGKNQVRLLIPFHLTAMLFILFDIEVVFLLPWALIYRDFLKASIPVILPIFFFLFVLGLGFIYELKKNALEWEK